MGKDGEKRQKTLLTKDSIYWCMWRVIKKEEKAKENNNINKDREFKKK